MSNVFMTGGTGYIGSRLIPELIARGHSVRAFVRPQSISRLPPGVESVTGNPLEQSSLETRVAPSDTFVQLVGVAHPGPFKGEQFKRIDLASVRASVAAARQSGIRHFVYVSIAHPAPSMQAYSAVRMEGEELIGKSGMNATILRPFYVLGPGHHWPIVLVPFYRLAELFPSIREGARRLGLVSIGQMIRAIADAVDHPPVGVRVLDVDAIKSAGN